MNGLEGEMVWKWNAGCKEKNMVINPRSLKTIRDIIIKAPVLIDAVQKLIDRIREWMDRWKDRKKKPLVVEELGSKLEEYDKMLEEQAKIIEELANVLGKVALQINVLMWVSGIASVVAIVAVLIAIFKWFGRGTVERFWILYNL